MSWRFCYYSFLHGALTQSQETNSIAIGCLPVFLSPAFADIGRVQCSHHVNFDLSPISIGFYVFWKWASLAGGDSELTFPFSGLSKWAR